jgi:hypothetical protein
MRNMGDTIKRSSQVGKPPRAAHGFIGAFEALTIQATGFAGGI